VRLSHGSAILGAAFTSFALDFTATLGNFMTRASDGDDVSLFIDSIVHTSRLTILTKRIILFSMRLYFGCIVTIGKFNRFNKSLFVSDFDSRLNKTNKSQKGSPPLNITQILHFETTVEDTISTKTREHWSDPTRLIS
jgi:hypothetical protein